jgi:hypothetical protein
MGRKQCNSLSITSRFLAWNSRTGCSSPPHWSQLSSCSPGRAGIAADGNEPGHHVQLDFMSQFDDGFPTMVIFEQRIAQRFAAVDEQATIETILMLDDPMAPAVLAYEDDRRCRTVRWRFDKLHVCHPRTRTRASSSALRMATISACSNMNSSETRCRSHGSCADR